LKPLDRELISHWVLRTKKILTVEENVLQGGFGSAVLELLQEEGLWGIDLMRLGIPDRFIEHGSQSLLRAKYGIDEQGIFETAVQMVEGRLSTSADSEQAMTSEGKWVSHPR
jgi:1-deoxy-D-xylulose-5-phosphate synthase